jgi:hypothetical protein
LFSLACGLGILFLASFLPIWRCWSVSAWCACGGQATLWEAAQQMMRGDPFISAWSWVFYWHGENWVFAFGIVAGGYGVAWVLLRLSDGPPLDTREQFLDAARRAGLVEPTPTLPSPAQPSRQTHDHTGAVQPPR